MSAAVPSRGMTPTRACRSGAQRYGIPEGDDPPRLDPRIAARRKKSGAACRSANLTNSFATVLAGLPCRFEPKSNATGKCVSAAVRKANGALASASATCKTLQADTNFAATHNNQTFNAFYGGNGKGKSADANAYGKCVSATAKATTNAQTQATVAAAKACKAAKTADKTAFATKYGTKANAFGKCVAATTKTS